MNKRSSSKKQSASRALANPVSTGTGKSKSGLSHLGRRDFLRISALGTAGAALPFAPGFSSCNIIEEWDRTEPCVTAWITCVLPFFHFLTPGGTKSTLLI